MSTSPLSAPPAQAAARPPVVTGLADPVVVLHPNGSALHAPSPGADIDLGASLPMRILWPALSRELAREGFAPVVAVENDIGDSWYVVAADRGDLAAPPLVLDVCADTDGIGRYGVPMGPVVATASHRDGVRTAHPAWEAVYLLSKDVRKRDALPRRGLQEAAANLDAFEVAAARVFGRRSAAALRRRASDPAARTWVAGRTQALRLAWAVRMRRLRERPGLPVLAATRWLRRAARPSGLYVQVCGPDGSGKSTIAARLVEEFGPFFYRTRHLHWRPGLLPRLGGLARRPLPDSERPHAHAPYGRVTSALRLTYYWLDQVLGYWARVRPVTSRSGLVVLERGFTDMIVDPTRYRLDGVAGLTRRLGGAVPDADLTLVLVGDLDVLSSRTSELDRGELERQLRIWGRIAGDGGGLVRIDAGRTPAEVWDDVRAEVLRQRAAVIERLVERRR